MSFNAYQMYFVQPIILCQVKKSVKIIPPLNHLKAEYLSKPGAWEKNLHQQSKRTPQHHFKSIAPPLKFYYILLPIHPKFIPIALATLNPFGLFFHPRALCADCVDFPVQATNPSKAKPSSGSLELGVGGDRSDGPGKTNRAVLFMKQIPNICV